MRSRLLTILIIIACISVFGVAYPAGNVITVDYDRDIEPVNKKVFGNNFKGRDPVHTGALPYYSDSDYGAGIWNPKWSKPNKKVMNLAKKAGVSIVRYAVGNHWDWKSSIEKKRKHFLFGLDEFLKTTEEIGAEAVIIVSPTVGNELDAADLVEYLNAPFDGTNINGATDWAEERARNGHPAPYRVKYFEMGNETYGKGSKIGKPNLYVNIYLKYYDAMKAVDPSIQIGFVLPPSLWHSWFQYGKVLQAIKEKIDYGILHRYINSIWSEGAVKKVSADDRLKVALSMPLLTIDVDIPEYLKRLKESSGKDIQLAISEYNSWHKNNEHRRLGAALVNAELLKIFMKPENNVLMANHWHMSNGLYGMVKADKAYQNNPYSIPIHYIKRPIYYVFELYDQHFGDVLIESEVHCDSYDLSKYPFYNELIKAYSLDKYPPSPTTQIPYLSVNTSKSNDGTKVYLMVINKNMENAITSAIELKNMLPEKKFSAWILNGPNVSSDNERNDNVKVTHKRNEIESNPFIFKFEPHSLTAIEITTRKE